MGPGRMPPPFLSPRGVDWWEEEGAGTEGEGSAGEARSPPLPCTDEGGAYPGP